VDGGLRGDSGGGFGCVTYGASSGGAMYGAVVAAAPVTYAAPAITIIAALAATYGASGIYDCSSNCGVHTGGHHHHCNSSCDLRSANGLRSIHR